LEYGVRGKRRKNLRAAITWGQNLEPLGLTVGSEVKEQSCHRAESAVMAAELMGARIKINVRVTSDLGTAL
jgi:hypothetical protein